MSAAFNRMTSTLESQRKLRRRLINDVSHELNTPLSVIHLEAKGLRDGLQTAEDASAHIIGEVDRLRGLVTDLNWLAETDHGELRLTFRACSVYELLADGVGSLAAPVPGSARRAVVAGISRPPARRHGPGSHEPGAGERPEQRRSLHPSRREGCTRGRASRATVGWPSRSSTTGSGSTPPDLPHVFDRFYRTDQSRSREIGGTGLGLAITRAIVLAHGGTVTVASDGPEQGATVTLRLPLNKRTARPLADGFRLGPANATRAGVVAPVPATDKSP